MCQLRGNIKLHRLTKSGNNEHTVHKPGSFIIILLGKENADKKLMSYPPDLARITMRPVSQAAYQIW